jgi:protein CLEC16A
MAPFWQSLLAPPKFSLANMSALHQQLQRTSVVSERNRATVVDALRTTAELVLWGDQNDPALFEFFLEKNILGIFWRLLEQWDTPSSVKVQILQTLSILISNIEAGPSIYYILSNDHINQLIRHPFDFSNEELLAHYVSLLKARRTAHARMRACRVPPLSNIHSHMLLL